MPTVNVPDVVVITLPLAVIGILFVAWSVPSTNSTAVTSLIDSNVEDASIVNASLAVTLNVAPFAVIFVFVHVVGNVAFTPSTITPASAVSLLSACVNVYAPSDLVNVPYFIPLSTFATYTFEPTELLIVKTPLSVANISFHASSVKSNSVVVIPLFFNAL